MKKSLVLGPIIVNEGRIAMSGLRWIIEDAQYCNKYQPIAFCNILFLHKNIPISMHQERRDFQVLLLAPEDGIINVKKDISPGGMIDQIPQYIYWNPEISIGELDQPNNISTDQKILVNLIFAAGQRYAEFAENRSNILSGWYQRTRMWPGDQGEIKYTLLALGICDLANSIRGGNSVPVDFLKSTATPIQVVLPSEGLLIPTISMLIDQMNRSAEETSKLVENFNLSIEKPDHPFEAQDFLFFGTLLTELTKNHLFEKCVTPTRDGIGKEMSPNILLTSLAAQSRRVFKHKVLGYSIAFHEFRLRELSPRVKKWIKDNFLIVTRDPSDIARELKLLTQLLGLNIHLIVANNPTNPNSEHQVDYSDFDDSTFNEINYIHSRQMNGVLDELAKDGSLNILDVNLISAKMGTKKNIPDGIHWSGNLEKNIAVEILKIISDLKSPNHTI
jgi:hypothetical protein